MNSWISWINYSDPWTLKDVLQTLFYGMQATSVITAILIYRHQSRKASASEKQANRARLTEAYMLWHSTILGHSNTTALSAKMFRRGHALVADEHVEISEEQAREIHLLCLLLNTLFLEWNYRYTYERKGRRNITDFPALNATIDNIISGMVINNHRHYRVMADNLRLLFPDFPPDFLGLIESRIAEIRARNARQSDSVLRA